jgi:hypothetical protein
MVGEAQKRKKDILMMGEVQKIEKKFSWWGKHKKNKKILMVGEAQKK